MSLYGQAVGFPPPQPATQPKDTALDLLLNHAKNIAQRIEGANDRIGSALDRIQGPAPEPVAPGEAAITGARARHASIEDMLHRASVAADRAHALAERLERLG